MDDRFYLKEMGKFSKELCKLSKTVSQKWKSSSVRNYNIAYLTYFDYEGIREDLEKPHIPTQKLLSLAQYFAPAIKATAGLQWLAYLPDVNIMRNAWEIRSLKRTLEKRVEQHMQGLVRKLPTPLPENYIGTQMRSVCIEYRLLSGTAMYGVKIRSVETLEQEIMRSKTLQRLAHQLTTIENVYAQQSKKGIERDKLLALLDQALELKHRYETVRMPSWRRLDHIDTTIRYHVSHYANIEQARIEIRTALELLKHGLVAPTPHTYARYAQVPSLANLVHEYDSAAKAQIRRQETMARKERQNTSHAAEFKPFERRFAVLQQAIEHPSSWMQSLSYVRQKLQQWYSTRNYPTTISDWEACCTIRAHLLRQRKTGTLHAEAAIRTNVNTMFNEVVNVLDQYLTQARMNLAGLELR